MVPGETIGTQHFISQLNSFTGNTPVLVALSFIVFKFYRSLNKKRAL